MYSVAFAPTAPARHRQRRRHRPDLGPRHRHRPATLTGHTARSTRCRSPRRHPLATASDDRTARIWDAATGSHGPPSPATPTGAARWRRPDGARLATASDDRTARIWDTATGTHLATLTGHTNSVIAVAVQPRRRTARHRQRRRHRPDLGPRHRHRLATLTGHTGPVIAVALSPDGTRIVTASGDRTARIWDAATGTDGHPHRPHRPVPSVAVRPDGTWLATASDDDTARIWDAATGTTTRHPHRPHQLGKCGGVGPTAPALATASDDGTARIWDTDTGAEPPASTTDR